MAKYTTLFEVRDETGTVFVHHGEVELGGCSPTGAGDSRPGFGCSVAADGHEADLWRSADGKEFEGDNHLSVYENITGYFLEDLLAREKAMKEKE